MTLFRTRMCFGVSKTFYIPTLLPPKKEIFGHLWRDLEKYASKGFNNGDAYM